MNFDDQLKRAVDTLGDRLRDDISRELRLLTDDLSVSATADREAAASLAAQTATETAEAAAQARAEQASVEAAEAVREAVDAVRAEHVEANTIRAAADAERAEAAALRAPQPTQTAQPVFTPADAHAAAAADDHDAAERLDSLIHAIRAIDQARSLSEVLEALLASARQEAARAGVLLVRDGRVRGWRFDGFAPLFDGSTVDVPLDESGIIGHAVEHQRPASSESDGSAPAFAELADHADSTEAIAFPIALGGEVVAVLYVDQPDMEPGVLTLEPAALEVLARYAGRALEALTAFQAARMVTLAGASSSGAGANSANNGGREGVIAHDEDEAARRYARLVISEIKLYHEDAVAEGRRDRNLATRLGGEIAHARSLYEQRVPPHLRGAEEHFHNELVHTLAGGDASLFAKVSLS
jgi:hypothetical protein